MDLSLDPIDRKIIETIDAKSSISGVSSRRGVNPEDVMEKLELSFKDYTDRVDNLRLRGFLEVYTGWVAVPTSKGRQALQESGKPMLKKIIEYVSKEYKINPIKTLAATLTILIIISGFGTYIFYNLVNSPKAETSSETDWIKKGSELTKQGDYPGAAKAYKEAINLNSNQPSWVWYALGTAYFKQEKYSESIPAYEMATHLDPKNANILADLGYAFYNTQRYDEALQAFNKSLDSSNQSYVWYAKGNSFYKLGNNNGAITAYEITTNLDPKNANAWGDLGYALYNTQRYDESLQAFNTSISLDPSRGYIWNAKGNALVALGRASEAEAAFAMARELGITS